MKDSAEEGEIVGPPVLPFRLRLAASLVRMAARWLRAAQTFATVAAESEDPDADALTSTASGAKAAAASANEAARAPEDSHEVTVALAPLLTDIAELTTSLDIRAEIEVDPAIDRDALRRIDLVRLVERLPRLCFALVEFGAGGARLTVKPDPEGGPDGFVLAGLRGGAAPIELARIAFAAPLAKPTDGDEAIPLDFGAGDSAVAAPARTSPPPKGFERQSGDIGDGFGPVEAPWIAVVERSPAARMILEDLGQSLPLAARLTEQVTDVDDAILAHPQLRGVLFDPGDRGVDWRAILNRISAARGGAVKPIAMTRCSTAEGDAYEKAGFALVIEKPVSAATLRAAATLCLQ